MAVMLNETIERRVGMSPECGCDVKRDNHRRESYLIDTQSQVQMAIQNLGDIRHPDLTRGKAFHRSYRSEQGGMKGNSGPERPASVE